MRTTAFLLTIAALVAAPGARAEAPVSIFDGRVDAAPDKLDAAETALLQRVVRPQARKAWEDTDGCSDDFTVLGRAKGAFTKPGASQSAVLYRFCNTGRQIGTSGVAVLESGRVVAHVIFEGGGEYAISALPDINENGLSEIAIAAAASGQGYMDGGIAAVELGARGVTKLGTFVTYRDNCGSDERRLTERAQELYVTPGAKPRFFMKGFSKPCDSSARWRTVSASVPARPQKDETSYRRLR